MQKFKFHVSSKVYFFRYSVNSLIASGICPRAFKIATRLFLGAAFVSSRLIIESKTSKASSYLQLK